MQALLDHLKAEPWIEYDTILVRSEVILTKRAFTELQKVAKAISKVRPEDTRGPGVPWYEGVLDDMV
jgi:hypothetical protein